MILLQWFIPLGGTRRIVLAGTAGGLFWLALAGATLVLLAVLYRYERRLVSRRSGVALLGLRIAAALALVAALLEPIGERTERERLRGRVVLGVDYSASMDTIDQPQSGRPPRSQSRLETAARLLEGRWLDRLREIGEVEAIGFARQSLSNTSAARLVDALRGAGSLDQTGRLATDWGPVLERGGEATADAPIVGVVLLTDGRHNAGGKPGGSAPAVERLKALGVPVHSVLVGSANAGRDAAVANLEVPDRVMKGDTVDLTATLKLDGEVPGALVPVRLMRARAVVEQKMATARADGARPKVTFHVPSERVGLETFTVAVGPVVGDQRPDNDERTVTVDVTDEKTRVLLVDGEARWEFRYLHNALARDAHVELRAIVFRQQAGDASSASYETALPALVAGEPDPINAFDLIALGDLAPTDLPEEGWKRLEWYVESRGGTLVWSGGRQLPRMLSVQKLARLLLPVTNLERVTPDAAQAPARHAGLPAGFEVVPADENASATWPMLRFDDDAERNRELWRGLPPQPWVWAGKAKPSGEVVARAAGGPASLQATDLIVAMPYGLGRVFWVGFEGTWRWRHRAGDARHHRFWGQVVRWASADRLTAGNEQVRFGTSKRHYEEAQPVTLRARFAESVSALGPDWLVVARIFRAQPAGDGAFVAKGDPVAVVPLSQSALQPRWFESTAPTLTTGVYLVRLDVPQLGALVDGEAVFEMAPGEGSERIELTATRDHVDRLAAETGGRVVDEEHAMDLFDALRPQERVRTRVETTSLWDRPAALVVFFTIVAIEWFLRKRAGLP